MNSAVTAGVSSVGLVLVHFLLDTFEVELHEGIVLTLGLIASCAIYLAVNFLRDRHPHLITFAEMLTRVDLDGDNQVAKSMLLAGLKSGSIKELKKQVAIVESET